MPFCPECRDEFEDWVEACPDCKVALVKQLPSLPETGEKRDEPLVKIATAPNEPIAQMWSGVLAEHNIPCLLKGGNLGAAMYIPTMILPHQLYVVASEWDRAKELLAPFLADEAGKIKKGVR